MGSGIFLANAATPPANDNFADAQMIGGDVSNDTGTISGNNVDATLESGEERSEGLPGGASVWFQWIPDQSGVFTFDTFGSDFDTLIEIYEAPSDASGVGDLVRLTSNDDVDAGSFGVRNLPGVSSVMLSNAVAGNLYYIVVDGFNGDSGAYNLNWKRGGLRASGEFEFTSTSYFGTQGESDLDYSDVNGNKGVNRDVPGVLVTVTRKNGSSGRVLVDYDVAELVPDPLDPAAPVPAVAFEDFIPSSGTLVFEDYQMSASFVVPILSPGASHIDKFKSFNVVLTAASLDPEESNDLASPVISSQQSVAKVAIADPNPFPNGPREADPTITDQVGSVQFERAHYRRVEGNYVAHVRVRRDGGNDAQRDAAVTVQYVVHRSINGDPRNNFPLSAGSDYATPDSENNGDYQETDPVVQTLTIPAQPGWADILIPIIDDNLAEFNEDIIIELISRQGTPSPKWDRRVDGAQSGYEVGFQNVAILTIMHDDYPAGAVDSTFNPDYDPNTNPALNPAPGTDGSVYSVAIQADGKSVIGGSFQNYNGSARRGIARMNTDGSLDTSFNPGDGANDFVSSVQLTSDGRLIVGGGFTSIGGVGRKSVARLNPNGTLDNSFNIGSGANGIVRCVAVQPDDKVLIAGEFTSFNGVAVNRVARLNSDGSLDTTFNPGIGPDDTVFAIAVEPNGGILIGGDFTRVNGAERNFIARLNPDGSVASDFNPGAGANGSVYAIAVQSDGKIVLGGDFTSFNSVSRNSIARLNQNGSLDFGFDCGSGADATVYAVALQPDGKIVLGGLFTSINGTRRVGVARLFAHGPVDTSFMDTAYNQFAGLINSYDNPAIESRNFVFAMALEQNGNVIIGGGFKKVGGGRGSKEVRPDQYDEGVQGLGGNFLDENTRATYRNRSNVARLIGGATPGPGNIEFSLDSYSVDQNASPFFVTLVRTNYTSNTNYLGATMASFSLKPLLPGPGAVTNSEVSLDPKYASVRWGSSWNRTNKLAYTRMQSDGFFGMNSATKPFSDTYVDNTLYAMEGEAYVFLDIDPNAADDGEKTILLELNRPKGTRIADTSRFSDLSPSSSALDDRFHSESYYYFDPSTAPVFTDPNLDWSLGGEFIPLGTALGRSSATLTVRGKNSQGTISFSEPEIVVSESATNAVVYVSRTDGTKNTVTVQYQTFDGNDPDPQKNAARKFDYLTSSGTLTFAENGTNRLPITIRILDDTIRENDEGFLVRLSNPTGGAKLGSQAVASVKIIDDDYWPGHLNFSAATFQGSEAEGTALISVSRTGGSAGAVSADYATSPGGSANEGLDYLAVSGTLTWANGEVGTKTFTVPLVADSLVEGAVPETVFLLLTNTTLNGVAETNVLGTRSPTAILEINDSDRYGSIGFNSPIYYANENSGGFVVTVVRTNGSAGAVSVVCSIANGASVTITNLSFAPGETSKGILIPIYDNPDPNPDLDIELGLANLSPAGAVMGVANAKLIVVDNESNNEPPGDLDTTFGAEGGANDYVYSLALQPNGKILVGGDFTFINGAVRNRIARLNADGTIDAHFSGPNSNFGADGSVRAIAVQSDSRILIGGFFNTVNAIQRGHIARLNANGTTDTTFNPGSGADSPVHALAETFVNGSRKLLLAGNFTSFNDVPRHGIARLNDDGSLDTTFDPGLGISSTNGAVYCLAVQDDGKVILGGDFVSFNGVPVPHVVRLNLDGSVDATFNPGAGPDGSVRAIAVQTDGKIVIGGVFTNVSGVASSRIARLNSNGTLDTTFTTGLGANDSVYAAVLQLDGKILLGGEFTRASGVTRNRLTRLNSDGTVDPTINFGTGADNFVSAIALQPDGKIIIGGGFTEFNNVSQPHVARLQGRSVTGDGTIEFVSGDFVVDENGTNAVIMVRRTGGTGTVGPIFVDLSTTDGTAEAGADYIDISSTLEFPVGETRQVISVPILDDYLVEGDETVHLALTNPSLDAALGKQPTATLTIRNDDAAISLVSSGYRFAENTPNGNAYITLVRTGSTRGIASVDFIMTTNGTATPDVDFAFSTNAIHVLFADGETSQSVAIPLINDDTIEGDETVVFQLANAAGAVLSAPFSAALIIVDDDFGPGNIAFAQPGYSVSETGLLAHVTLVRTNGSAGFIGINYATVAGGTASEGTDYFATNGTISFGPGELVKTFAVRILDDAIAEGDESIRLLLSNPTGGAAIAGTNSAPLVIEDNEIALSFTTPAFVVDEGSGGATISVRRASGTNETVTVRFATSDLTATNGLDYIGKTNSITATNTLVFAPGETLKTFTVPILEDALVEGDESFSVRLFDPSSNAQLASPSNAIVTIVDNDSSFSFATNRFVVDESGTNVMVTVARTNTSVGMASIHFSTSNLTASAGADYTATNGTLTFLDGEIFKTILIPIVDDASVEGDESFAVHLSNPGDGSVIGQPETATVTIIDNDAGLRFSSPAYSVSESAVSASITVSRTVVTNSTVTVNYTVANGTATDGLDYISSSGTLTFTNGETSKTFVVSIIDDTAIEGDETVLLNLETPSFGSAIVNPGAAVLTIRDNDGSLIVPAGSALISESGPANGVIDPSENVSLYFAFRNTVGADTANLVATLLPGGGITSPSGPQNYGALKVGGASVSRPFSFTASGTNGQQILATFQLQDGQFDLGTATFSYTLGSTSVVFTNATPIIINDSSAPPTQASPYPSTINVSGIIGSVSGVTVTLSNLNHTFPDDVDILLVSPSGQKIVLMSDAGGGSGNPISNRVISFDDNASNYLPDSTLIASGNYKPTDYIPGDVFAVPAPAGPYSSTLSVLNGSNPNGTWSLYVSDDTFFNSGSIAGGWSLKITTSSGLTPTADLSLTMSDAPDPAATGNELTYTLTITNHGPSVANDIVITNFLPPGVTFISQTCHCTNVDDTLVCPLDYLPKDGVLSFQIVVSPDVVGLITNTAIVRANEFDPNLLNNTASEVTTVDIPRADLGVTITDAPDPVEVNTDLTYSIVVQNFGPALAESVSLTNQLPPGSTLKTAFSSQGTHDTNTPGVVVFHWDDLIPGSFHLATVTVQFPLPGTVTNKASTGSSTVDPFKSNNTAAVKSIVELPPVILSAADGGLSVSWGTNAPSFVLQSTTNLSDAAVWVPVTNVSSVIDGKNQLIIDLSTGSRFFRLGTASNPK